MGFFSKDKIISDQLVESLVGIVFRSISDNSFLQKYKYFLKSMNFLEDIENVEQKEINPRQKREIIILKCLAVTRAIQEIFINPNEAKNLLDKFHVQVYSKISDFKKEQISFEQLMNKRYQAYYQILESKDINCYFLGKQFSDYFLLDNMPMKKNSGMALYVGTIFNIDVETFRELLNEMITKFKIIF